MTTKDLIKLAGTQAAAAERLGVSTRTISGWASGANVPPGDKLLALMRMAGVTQVLFAGDGACLVSIAGDRLLRSLTV